MNDNDTVDWKLLLLGAAIAVGYLFGADVIHSLLTGRPWPW